MNVGGALLDLARAAERRSIFVVGTAKNAGKTVALRAIANAAAQRGMKTGITSIGRDGESVDATDAIAKPRLFLSGGTVVATARNLLPRHPAAEIADLTPWKTASGDVVIARVRRGGFFEIAGPATAAGIRACVDRFESMGCDPILIDGAVDRVAALAGGRDAVVIAAGASGARTVEEAVDEARALAARLRVPAYDPQKPHVRVEGALTASRAASFAATGESRQIVVRDPTRIAMAGKALLGALQSIDVRCERPLHVIAATVASIGRERYFEPRAFARAVAQATQLPVFDVYAEALAVA